MALLTESDGGPVQKGERKVGEEPRDTPDDAPELTAESSDAELTPKLVPMPTIASDSEHQAFRMTSRGLKRKTTMAASSLNSPPFRRQRSNNFFERSAFFAAVGRDDSVRSFFDKLRRDNSVRSLSSFPGSSPSHSRQGSFTGASTDHRVIPARNTATSNVASLSLDDVRDVSEAPASLRSLERGTSEEFGYDFY